MAAVSGALERGENSVVGVGGCKVGDGEGYGVRDGASEFDGVGNGRDVGEW